MMSLKHVRVLKQLLYATFVIFDGGLYEWCSGN